MTFEEVIVIIIRIIGSIPVLYFPFFGSIFAVIVDLSDLFIIGNLDLGGVRNYQRLDKILDFSYMITFFLVSLKWSKFERNLSISLFIFRVLGMILYEVTGSRIILFSFPNIFEFWFIGISFYKLRKKILTLKNMILILFFSAIFKIFQEWLLHQNKFLDNYAMGDILSVLEDIFTFL